MSKHLPHYKYLTDKEFGVLENYTHFAPKTRLETWMLDNVTCHIERNIPSCLSANSVTLIGNLGLWIAGAICILNGGLKYHDSADIPAWCLIFAAFCV